MKAKGPPIGREQFDNNSPRGVTNKLFDELLTTYSHAAESLDKKRLILNDAMAEFRQAERNLGALAKELADRYMIARGK